MSRLLFFVLLIANLAFGAHLWLAGTGERTDFSARERNRDEVKLVANLLEESEEFFEAVEAAWDARARAASARHEATTSGSTGTCAMERGK